MIKLVDLSRQEAPIEKRILRFFRTTLRRKDFILGRALEDFEERFARYLGVPCVVGVGSGGAALTLSLMALGIGPGDEVITQANTYIATAYAALAVGARPVLVDVDPRTFQIDPEKLEAAVTRRTKVILPAHLYGYAAPMKEILEIARKRHLRVVEDVAQASGTVAYGKKCGTFGALAGFSFYPGKNLGGWGDGGAVAAQDKKTADRVRLLRTYGDAKKNHHTEIGINSRLDTVQAAVLDAKLDRLDRWNEERRHAASRYVYWFKHWGLDERVVLPPLSLPDQTPNFHLFVIQVPPRDRDFLRADLLEQGVECGVHYPVPIHLQPAIAGLGYKRGAFPVAEGLSRSILSLPIYGGIREGEIRAVVRAIRDYFSRKR